MRFIFQVLCLAIASISIDVQATSLEQAYLDEQTRILSLPFDVRLTALSESNAFDRQTALGEYFYQNTRYWSTEEKQYTGLQGPLREKLKRQHPYFYVEMMIDEVQYTSSDAGEQYFAVMEVAEAEGFFDLASYAALQASDSYFIDGRLLEAAEALKTAIEFTRSPQVFFNVRNVIVNDVLYTLASIYMLLGELDAAARLCHQASTAYDITSETYWYSQICFANLSYYSGEPQKTLDIIYPLFESKDHVPSNEVLSSLYWFATRANNQLGLYNEALEFGLLGLENNTDPNSISLYLGLIYTEIVKSYVALGDKDNSARYTVLLEEAIKEHNTVPITYRKFLVAKALNQELQGDYSEAYDTMVEILEIDEKLKLLNVNKSAIIDTAEVIDDSRVNHLEAIASKVELQKLQRNVAIAFSLVFSLICYAIYWRKQHKLKALANVVKRDASTGLFSYGYSLLALANTLKRPSSTPACLALIKVGNLNLAAKQNGGDYVQNCIISIAKQFQSTLPNTFTLGRYSHDTFIAVFPMTYATEAEQILRDSISAYANETRLYSSSITLSAAVLEISGSPAPHDLLEHCEALLPQNPLPTEFVISVGNTKGNLINDAVALT